MKTKYYLLIVTIITFCSCKKDWLDKKRDISLVVPTTLQDMRLLMNNDNITLYDTRSMTEASCDDFYTPQSFYDALTAPYEKNAYTWEPDVFASAPVINDWDGAYQMVLYSNVVLDGLEKIERNTTNATEYDAVKGIALFHRSRSFLNLVLTFAKNYDLSTAENDPGIPLKLTSDVSETITRASVKQVYDRIVSDLSSSITLLPPTTTIKTDPCKVSAYGLLARCYLYMGKYDLALAASNESYNLQNTLIDFNTLNATATRPIASSNVESQIRGQIIGGFSTFSSGSYIDTTLYKSYDDNDLRKTMFFIKQPDGGMRFRGSYVGTANLFGGTATDEILLIRSECKARLNDIVGAITDLNTLLIKRYKASTFVPVTANNQTVALQIILKERRKELLRRGLRWADLKRLNADPSFANSLVRNINNKQYTLPPNDARYVMPIPDYVIKQNGISQNLR